jgi:fructoselysine and glucoselysine-specific PTS system IIB component
VIKLLRVDDRLLHGQVAFAWTRALDIDCILVANDDIINDGFRKSAIGMAKPAGVKLVIKNISDSVEAIVNGKTDSYKLLIVTESIRDAALIARGVPKIKEINLGGIRTGNDWKMISKAVSVSEEDIKLIRELDALGIEVEVRQVPAESKVKAVTLL